MPAMHPRTRDRAALAAVPVLLAAVALVQIGRAHLLDQSSYAGFGFGMFATYENELSRWTEVTATTAEGERVRVGPPAQVDLQAQEVPTRGNAERLAEAVLESHPSFVAARASVWTIAIDGRPMQLRRVLIVEAEATRPS